MRGWQWPEYSELRDLNLSQLCWCVVNSSLRFPAVSTGLKQPGHNGNMSLAENLTVLGMWSPDHPNLTVLGMWSPDHPNLTYLFGRQPACKRNNNKKYSIPCRSVIGRFRGSYRRQDKGITIQKIVENYLPNDPAAHPTTLESSAALLWEHRISHNKCFLLNLRLFDKMVWWAGGYWESLPQFKTYLEA